VGVALESLSQGQGVINVLVARKNESLTVSQVEEQTLQSIQRLKIGDEVDLLIHSSLQHLSADGTLQGAIQDQLTSLNLTQQLNMLETKLALLSQKLGSGGALAQSDASRLPQTVTRFPASLSLSGSLKAMDGDLRTLQIADTLIVGGNTRIAGDLSLDGTLTANHLFVPSGMQIDGPLSASLLDIQSGAVIHGALTITQSLRLAPGATLLFETGSTLSLHDLIVRSALQVLGPITIQGLASFLGDVQIQGQLVLSSRQAGEVTLLKGQQSITVPFIPAFAVRPVVSASPDFPVLYAVTHTTATGFTIRIAAPASQDITFSWISVGVATSSGSSPFGLTSAGLLAFPVDSQGMPVSRSALWNSCIRNLPILDDSGKPMSCDAFHQGNIWQHPDLGITFTLNTSTTPPSFILPKGYGLLTVDRAAPLVTATTLTDMSDVHASQPISSASSSEVSSGAASSTASIEASSSSQSSHSAGAVSNAASSVSSSEASSATSSTASIEASSSSQSSHSAGAVSKAASSESSVAAPVASVSSAADAKSAPATDSSAPASASTPPAAVPQ
jgi:cytoskeletal protein CcmA (bactofilin family)